MTEKCSCPYAGTIRIRFKGFPRRPEIAGPLAVSQPLGGAPLGITLSIRTEGRCRQALVSTGCLTGQFHARRRRAAWGKARGKRLRCAAACGSLNAMLGFFRAASVLALLLGLAGCGLVDPFETGTPDTSAAMHLQGPSPISGMTSAQDAAATAGAIDPSSVPVSVCYSRLGSTPQKVIAIAAQECGPDKPPILVEQKWDLHSCPLMTPIRATFVCGAH